MRCVNCRRTVADDDSQCPFCGCPVLTAVAHPEQMRVARELSRLWSNAPAGDNVVSLRNSRRARIAQLWRDVAFEALLLAAAWTAVAMALGVARAPLAWVAGLLALGVDAALLTVYGVRPWYWTWAQPDVEVKHDDPPGSSDAVGMS